MSARQRVEGQRAFILHVAPFRETSALAEAFTRGHGRLAVVARGARRPRSSLRGLLMEFQPLELSWFGRGEVRTLSGAEWMGGQPLLRGQRLLFGYYLNELLLKLMPREDPHPELFDRYREALLALSAPDAGEEILRRFEVSLLRLLGYGVTLDRDARTGEPVDPERRYAFVADRGVQAISAGESDAGAFSGGALLAMARDDYSQAQTLREGRLLMRQAIAHHLGGAALNTRRVFAELQEL
jgi:DNA repair protein RecO (recombination protein O)